MYVCGLVTVKHYNASVLIASLGEQHYAVHVRLHVLQENWRQWRSLACSVMNVVAALHASSLAVPPGLVGPIYSMHLLAAAWAVVNRYMAYFKQVINISSRTQSPLAWLEAGSKNGSLLDTKGYKELLHYSSISGNTDAAIVTRASMECLVPKEGLCILFELKKEVKPNHVYQAACELFLAKQLQACCHPDRSCRALAALLA